MHTTAGTDPVRFDFEAPQKIDNWRPLVQWILAIPHLVIASVLGNVANVIWVISFFTVLFTERIPEGLYNFQVMHLRYQARAYSYAAFMRESYPAFDFTMSPQEPGGDPVQLSIDPPQTLKRWMPLVKWLLAIPHLIVMAVLGIGAFFALIGAFFVVLFTGQFPLGIRDFIVKYARYSEHVYAYIYLLRDEYPAFGLR